MSVDEIAHENDKDRDGKGEWSKPACVGISEFFINGDDKYCEADDEAG